MNAVSYPAALRELVLNKPLQPLGPGRSHADKKAALQTLDSGAAFAPHAVKDETMARACMAGLWLAYDFLDESHNISQDLETVEGSYWHALLHRREPDYANSKYWFRRVGRHEVFAALAEEARRQVEKSGVVEAKRLPLNAWDPFAFVDLCQQAANGPATLQRLCQEIQNREWELLFDYCLEAAIS
jgi:hypothetical protein